MTDATGARHPSNIQALKMAFELSSIEDIMRAKKYIVKKHTICLSPRGFVGSPQVRSCLESKKKCAQGKRKVCASESLSTWLAHLRDALSKTESILEMT